MVLGPLDKATAPQITLTSNRNRIYTFSHNSRCLSLKINKAYTIIMWTQPTNLDTGNQTSDAKKLKVSLSLEQITDVRTVVTHSFIIPCEVNLSKRDSQMLDNVHKKAMFTPQLNVKQI